MASVISEMHLSTILLVVFLVSSIKYKDAEARSDFNYTLDDGYPIGSKLFGGIAGVDIDKDGNVIIFHRGSQVWDGATFDGNDIYIKRRDEPIMQETVVTIDPNEKKIIRAWGRSTFFMPHGLSLDQSGNYLWLTDVALHQVFKYPINGSKELISLGVAFTPGNDETHFCKPTSVADTGEFVFVADGYCNSRVVMFSIEGNYLGEFGQSSDASYISSSAIQPTFNIPHKIIYARDSRMLCVADRENGRIQCFSFEPRHDKLDKANDRLILNGAIKLKFVIADPQFNGRLFSLDYSPLRGGIIFAVSGQSLFSSKPPLGFVYNVTTGQLLSKFTPPNGQTFGMAHDLAISGEEAGSLFVVDITPVNLWKFSRPYHPSHKSSRTAELTMMAGEGFNRAITMVESGGRKASLFLYIFVVSGLATVLFLIGKSRRVRYAGPNSLYSNSYPASLNRLFSNGSFRHRPMSNGAGGSMLGTMFSRRSFYNLFKRERQQQSDFSRLPMEESDNSDDNDSDSDVEEFNISQANPSIKINV